MNLEELRKHIDEIDDKLFALLKERLEYVEKVGKLKKSNASHQYIIRPGREALKVKKAFAAAKHKGFNDKISLAFASLWRELISLSINHEEEAKVAFSGESKETLWMLREYFGVYSDKQQMASEKDVMAALKSKKANIGAFAVNDKPTDEPWWIDLSKQSELNIFANLPLFPVKNTSTITSTNILLVSNVTPEPCGEDKFVYAISKPLPREEQDNFEVLAEYKGSYLVISDEFYNNYLDKLGAKYLGCYATFEF